MREQLFGYLLNALDEDERRAVEQRLRGDAALRDELDEVAQCLSILAADAGGYEPPAGLAERTCRGVFSKATTCAAADARALAGRWTIREWVTGLAVLAASLCVLIPAVNESRFNAGLTRCQDNLRALGMAFSLYSGENRQQPECFPHVPTKGNLAFAGVYAPRLRYAGFVEDPAIFVCPDLAEREASPFSQRRSGPRVDEIRVPTIDELLYASPEELGELRRQLSGFYGYTLGVLVDGRYRPVRNQGRTTFAILADSPSQWLDGRPGANHGGRGVNVLFEYGNVRFIKSCAPGQADSDYFFLNDEGRVAAGVHSADAVVVPVHVGPGVE